MKISFFGNPEKDEIARFLPQWVSYLEANSHQVTMTQDLADIYSQNFKNIKLVDEIFELCEDCDLLVSLGGDGTILWAAQLVMGKDIPLLGVKFGGLGFLAEISPEEFQVAIDEISVGKWKLQKRLMLEGRIENGQGRQIGENTSVLNEFSVVGGNIGQVSRVDVWVDDNHVSTYIADGILISTPTGSTAYSLAARGPLLMPTADSMIIAPICPHTLTARPLVVDGSAQIKICPADDEKRPLFINADGREISQLAGDQQLHIQKSANYITLLHRADRTFFDILRAKLNWGDDIRQSENGKR
ncbi:MAG: NAD(+)/NADH kinase [Calditrichaeota bacterium]|nr:MAG: NAD(+)/NADH kinase [Calditrichota bacterium]